MEQSRHEAGVVKTAETPLLEMSKRVLEKHEASMLQLPFMHFWFFLVVADS